MDRAGKIIRGLPLGVGSLPAEDLLRSVWPQAVGKKIAGHTRVVAVRESEEGLRMVVEVADAVWQSQLQTMAGQILPRLRDLAGTKHLKSIEYRVGVPRRMPKRAEQARPSNDEADGIADPVLRHVYRAARRKSAG